MQASDRAWDAAIIGAGLIGLATARELHARGLRVLLLERGQAGREASWAGAGMLAAAQLPAQSPLLPLARASADIYPAFCRALESETGVAVDYRPIGTVLPDGQLVADHCVDNRLLVAALLHSVRRRAPGIQLREHCPAAAVLPASSGGWIIKGDGAASGGPWAAAHVVNAAGAWAASIRGAALPVRPRKGQLLAVQGPPGLLPRVQVGEGVYLVPRSTGRIVIGATLEDNGFAKTLDPAAIARLRARADALAPAIAVLPEVERWAGLRPGAPDGLPFLGPIAPRLWAATGHFRDGILLAPITAQTIAGLITGDAPDFDLTPFAPARALTPAH